jgi:hypothetical protein
MGERPADLDMLREAWRRFLEDECQDLIRTVQDRRVRLPDDPDVPERWPSSAWVEGPCWDVVAALRDWLGEAECSAMVVELMPLGLQIHGLVRVDDWCVDGAGFHTLEEAHARYVGGPLADDDQFIRMRTIGWHAPEFWGWGSLLIPPRSELADELRRRIGRHLDQDGFLAALRERPAPKPSREVVATSWDEPRPR